MDPKKLLEQARAALAALLTERTKSQQVIDSVREACEKESRDPNETEATSVVEARAAKKAIDPQIDAAREAVADAERDVELAELAKAVVPTGSRGANLPGPDGEQIRVGQEPRTYARETDPKGKQFLLDVSRQMLFGDPSAANRLNRHMQEEAVDRAAAGSPLIDRATGTAAFSGLVVPQYLVDMFAPAAKAGRPFADACRHHDLPATGMTVNIGRMTTGTSTAVQTEGSGVSETDADDTLLTINVQTNAGQQTISRQAIERGAGVDDTTLDDLFRAYSTTLDSTLLNQATNGLTNVATSIAYTDGTPTAAELYPKLLQAPAAVEAALLDMDPGDVIAVMHSRRWYWLQSQLTSTWPLFGQPGAGGVQNAGVNYGERYGSGFRGVLPSGAPVIVDNNIATNFGAGTNEDEIYTVAQSEAHLWEDPSAPLLIRAEQTKAANLQVLFVVYGYFAYSFARRPHAQKINGTGLVTPTF